MANEQKVTVKYEVVKGNFQHKINLGTLQFDQATGRGGDPGVLAATTNAQTVTFVSTPGYVFVRNLSTGNKVKLTSTGNDEFAEFTAGKVALIPKGSGGWKLTASTAGGTANVDIRGFST